MKPQRLGCGRQSGHNGGILLRVGSSSQAGYPAGDPEVAAAARLLHRRQGWGRTAITFLIGFALAGGGYSSAQDAGTPPPLWFAVVVIALGALAVVGIVVAVVDTMLLRRKPAAVRAQAVQLAARHPSRPHARHYPPRHPVSWAFRWIGMLLILVVAVVSVPGVVNGVAYLAGAEKMVTFDPVSYQTNCYRGGCQTSTVGTLQTGGAGTQATWPNVVPLGVPFQVREPVWKWGFGGALIDSDGIAVAAIVISLLLEGVGVLVVVYFVKLTRNWLRHRRVRLASVSAS